MAADVGPFFSIVIPLYNKSRHIAATLASIAGQAFDDYELIVVDDGSTDDGSDKIPAADDRIRLVRQSNAGPGMARNRGITEARGRWIAFLDADDLWRPEHLSTLAATIAACPDADVVATGFSRGGATISAKSLSRTMERHPHVIDFFCEHETICTSTIAVRAEALRDERFGAVWPGEDVDLWTRLALHHRFAVHPARTAQYVQNTGGAMDSQATAVPSLIKTQPVFVTIAAILRDPAYAHRHDAVRAFRNRLLTDYTRPTLFNGQTVLARAYLAALREGGGHAPLLYRCLSHLPGWLVRIGSVFYGKLKCQLVSRVLR